MYGWQLKTIILELYKTNCLGLLIIEYYTIIDFNEIDMRIYLPKK